MIHAQIDGAAALAQQLGLTATRARDELRAALDLAAHKLLARAQRKLSGEVLHARSGRLRASLTLQVQQDAAGITATLGAAAAYAQFQELGFSGPVSPGQRLRARRGALAQSIKGRAAKLPRPAQARQIDYAPHSFLAAALAELGPELAADIEAAAARALG